jgi:hypothetical protein
MSLGNLQFLYTSFRDNVQSWGRQTLTGSKMFPQQCFLVCPGLKTCSETYQGPLTYSVSTKYYEHHAAMLFF